MSGGGGGVGGTRISKAYVVNVIYPTGLIWIWTIMYLHQAHIRATINLIFLSHYNTKQSHYNMKQTWLIYDAEEKYTLTHLFCSFYILYSFHQCAQKGICKYSRDIKMPIIH